MAYKILKPEIISVPSAAWSKAKSSWVFWMILTASIFLTSWFVIIIIITAERADQFLAMTFFWIFIPLAYLLWVQHKVATLFWKQVAEINGWRYRDSTNLDDESGIMFRQGNHRAISRHIDGVIEDRQFRIFNYVFSIGSGRHRTTYAYTVFSFKFNGSFPHIYLNNKHNSYSISTGEKIPLPLEFNKQFSLSAPRKYEIEALQIFTPDVLAKMLDNGFIYDIEFVEQEVLMFVDGVINDFQTLEKHFNMALQLEDLLDEKLDRFKFNTIGNMPHTLK